MKNFFKNGPSPLIPLPQGERGMLEGNECVLIVGYGLTGKALAAFFEDRKIPYAIYDDKEFHCEGNFYVSQTITEKNFDESWKIKFLFPSPGVSLDKPIVQAATAHQVPIIGELALASHYLTGEFIAVTGTNGKSTTVRLIDALLRGVGVASMAAGNIGTPLIAAVSESPKSFYVLEESSYQLELVGSLRHKIAICLNVTDDHRDRYPSMQAYAAAKANIIKNSTSEDFFIYNVDDRFCAKMAEGLPVKKIPFSLNSSRKDKDFDGAYADAQHITIKLWGREFTFPHKECSLKGLHNRQNIMAALLAALLLKSDAAAVAAYQRVLREFVGLPHRMQLVLQRDGLSFYDDSKATNVNAVAMALASFAGNVILIAGGRDKNSDFSVVKGLVGAKVKKLILIGEARHKMAGVFAGVTDVVCVPGLPEAVAVAVGSGSQGDTILLSPACASFDQYRDFNERGEHFTYLVQERNRNVG